ncbi:DUF2628 domain-containing protein [Xenorhabdus hominickii]|uniref:DUF2628 domain-containing protein n=1 Tax=Xenorhabdus hominickii TaxID=351679 RepID=A0A2G0QGQ6_XENHO|nr:DUF2628 domain-containing protein [Xenorhabdus hominickii]AOM42375.1 hypothetical protein A9255_18535 [Xenorhabdus hominickii]PHM58387.1 hypothetical protein Xhom_01413 [Xenorhabdus hominickii]
MDISKYPEKWQERFKFFEQNGSPASQDFKVALKNLPAKSRILININWLAFLFGIFYFLFLGLWKKGLSLLAFSFLLIVAISSISEVFIYGATGLIYVIWGFTVNYAYYLKEIKGEDGWNPFKDIFTKQKHLSFLVVALI